MKGKKGKKKGKHPGKEGLNGFNIHTVLQTNPEMEHKHLLCLAGVSAAGGALGIIAGRPSLGIGVVLAGLGVWQKNAYLAAAGGSMAIACIPDYNKSTSQVKGISEEINGFDLKEFAQDAKQRAGLLWDNLAYKLYLPKKSDSTTTSTVTDKTTNGLNGEEKVTYFVNPYNQANKQPDLSELNKVSAEIEANYPSRSVEGTEEENIEAQNY